MNGNYRLKKTHIKNNFPIWELFNLKSRECKSQKWNI